MDLLVNDLSLHGQFADLEGFQRSIGELMKIRQAANRHRRAFYCHRNLVNGQVTADKGLPAAVQTMPLDQKRVIMGWLTQQGPFWEDDRLHEGGDWYECRSDVVTDTAIGEVAHCVLNGVDRALVSFEPSDFAYSPVSVDHIDDDGEKVTVDVLNFWQPATAEAAFVSAPQALVSWAALRDLSVLRFDSLTFAENAFEPLKGQPFKVGVAERILVRLEVLSRLKGSFGADGALTHQGHEIYGKHFAGGKPWFSDSSDSEKVAFRTELTFKNPDVPGQHIFCPWHGKVKTPQYRVHFSWPITADAPVYVVYVGPKITKK